MFKPTIDDEMSLVEACSRFERWHGLTRDVEQVQIRVREFHNAFDTYDTREVVEALEDALGLMRYLCENFDEHIRNAERDFEDARGRAGASAGWPL